MTRKRNTTKQPVQDAASAKASEYHRAIGSALEQIADQIPAHSEIHIVITPGMFEARLIRSGDGSEVPVNRDFEEFADELVYLLDFARASAP